MPDKAQIYAQMADDTARKITGDYLDWATFLATSSRLYKYPFHDQLLIYAQRPDATACASYDLWNDTMRRYVKRGAKGIGLFDRSGDQPRIRYVFDVSDTGERRNSRPVRLWTIREGYEEPVRDAFAEACGVRKEETLVGTVRAAAQLRASDYWDRYSDRILGILDGSLLADYDEDGIRASRMRQPSGAVMMRMRFLSQRISKGSLISIQGRQQMRSARRSAMSPGRSSGRSR